MSDGTRIFIACLTAVVVLICLVVTVSKPVRCKLSGGHMQTVSVSTGYHAPATSGVAQDDHR